MIASLPEALQRGPNENVLTYLAGRSAHSDIALPLWQAVKELPNVRLFCSDREDFGYVVVYVDNLVFGFADGMGGITLRLPPPIVERLSDQRTERRPAIGPDWVYLPLFGDNGFETQLARLAVIAHAFAEPPPNNSLKPKPLRGAA